MQEKAGEQGAAYIPMPKGRGFTPHFDKINYIKVAALYGHTTIGPNFPSISLSPAGSISISFSGNVSIDKIGGHKVKIGTDSTIEDL